MLYAKMNQIIDEVKNDVAERDELVECTAIALLSKKSLFIHSVIHLGTRVTVRRITELGKERHKRWRKRQFTKLQIRGIAEYQAIKNPRYRSANTLGTYSHQEIYKLFGYLGQSWYLPFLLWRQKIAKVLLTTDNYAIIGGYVNLVHKNAYVVYLNYNIDAVECNGSGFLIRRCNQIQTLMVGNLTASKQ